MSRTRVMYVDLANLDIQHKIRHLLYRFKEIHDLDNDPVTYCSLREDSRLDELDRKMKLIQRILG